MAELILLREGGEDCHGRHSQLQTHLWELGFQFSVVAVVNVIVNANVIAIVSAVKCSLFLPVVVWLISRGREG